MSDLRVLTPPGRGAVATLQLEGIAVLDERPPLFVAANGRPMSEQPLNRLCFGHWGQDAPEEVVLCRVTNDTAEIHSHGGDAAVSRIVAELRTRGVERVDPLSVGSADADDRLEDPIESACRSALTRATTMRTADILWQQCEGRLSEAFAELETLPPTQAERQAERMLRWASFALHLTQPWQVVLCGRPNVGKSSLINALVGFGRSIVYDQPGTTRDVVTVETALDGWPIEFSDTAGLRDDADELESAGIARARRRLESADLRLLLLDVGQPPHDDDRRMLAEWPDALIVAHKSDLSSQWDKLPSDALNVSSMSGEGVDELTSAIVARLIPEVPPPMTMLPINAQLAARVDRYLSRDP